MAEGRPYSNSGREEEAFSRLFLSVGPQIVLAAAGGGGGEVTGSLQRGLSLLTHAALFAAQTFSQGAGWSTSSCPNRPPTSAQPSLLPGLPGSPQPPSPLLNFCSPTETPSQGQSHP